MNHEKENKRIHYGANLINKGHKTFLFFFFFFDDDIRRLIKKLIITGNSTYYKEFISNKYLYKYLAENENLS